MSAYKISSVGDERSSVKKLSEEQIKDLVVFLESLTDPCIEREKCLSDWVPTSKDMDPDNSILKIN